MEGHRISEPALLRMRSVIMSFPGHPMNVRPEINGPSVLCTLSVYSVTGPSIMVVAHNDRAQLPHPHHGEQGSSGNLQSAYTLSKTG